jgi:hypothetical protein
MFYCCLLSNLCVDAECHRFICRITGLYSILNTPFEIQRMLPNKIGLMTRKRGLHSGVHVRIHRIA